MPGLSISGHETLSQASPVTSSNSMSEKTDGLTGLVFCSAEDLAIDDGHFNDLDIDHRFVRLARHHERRDSNGLFGCRTVQKGRQEPLTHDSWCCFKIKQVRRGEPESDVVYEWEQPSINISWNARDHVTLLLCMDTPGDLQAAIQDAWDCGLVDGSDPYRWHCFIVDKVTDLYNRSVWGLRDFVRLDVEKRRSPEFVDFERLHEIARHIIHSNETLEVALSTLEGMLEAHQVFSEQTSGSSGSVMDQFSARHSYSSSGKVMDFSARHTQLEMSALRRTVKATFLRSKSLSDRLNNEINLAYNLVNQRDSFLMKTIAVMTLIYLPGSYIASIFGMNLFDFSAADGLEVSHMFWLYWVLMVILTLITVGTWVVWQYQSKHVRKQRPAKESQGPPWTTSWELHDWVKVRRRTGVEVTPEALA
ncbi:mg2+ transporter zinc transport protein [Diplodia corticola]|uniref:Mg2+ transporter zinc transport protein n=1 Tax=Diplodia corticola TaxID=236234 RepID=A0A1J9S0B9_9PEZI|nr:mg2+ transporter zinc transport protein [Diplodia corticola]OJD33125.1 mg2+ transporter zinc transport protein [Diplodia corticola]